MSLHDHLSDTLERVDPHGPDLMALAAGARTRGTRLRRRRRTAFVAVAAGVVVGLTGGAVALVESDGGSRSTVPVAVSPVTTVPPVEPDLTGPHVATTAPGAAVALHWAVAQQRTGSADVFAGQLSSISGDYHVRLRWSDGDAGGVSQVELNVQRNVMLVSCSEMTMPCRSVTLPDGSQLFTYEERIEVDGGTAVRRVADLRRVDGTRVVALSNNGIDAGDHWDITRPEPPLTSADLEAVVRSAFWGPRLPVAFVGAGRELTDYTDEDASSWVEPARRR